MKLIRLSEKLLKLMVLEYTKSETQIFNFQFFLDTFPDETESRITKALDLLYSDNFISVQYADDIPYATFLKVAGLRLVEENTMLQKGYTILKEIRSLLP